MLSTVLGPGWCWIDFGLRHPVGETGTSSLRAQVVAYFKNIAWNGDNPLFLGSERSQREEDIYFSFITWAFTWCLGAGKAGVTLSIHFMYKKVETQTGYPCFCLQRFILELRLLPQPQGFQKGDCPATSGWIMPTEGHVRSINISRNWHCHCSQIIIQLLNPNAQRCRRLQFHFWVSKKIVAKLSSLGEEALNG